MASKFKQVHLDDINPGDEISVRAGDIHEYIGVFTQIAKNKGMYAIRLWDGDSITYIPTSKIKWILMLERHDDQAPNDF